MVHFSSDRLKQLFNTFSKRKVIVLGDLMLDRYLWGKVSRISPEAPVPVVDIDSQSVRSGGAANVSANVTRLGAKSIPIGVIGGDDAGQTLIQLFKEKDLPVDGLIVDPKRPTTEKTRIIAHDQHVVRTDYEIRDGISADIQKKIMACLEDHLDADGIIIEDYNKGLLVPDLIKNIIKLARKKEIPVFVDPKFSHFFEYKHVTLFKPNRKEVADKMGVHLDIDSNLQEVGMNLLKRLNCAGLLITLGEHGMALFESQKTMVRIPTRAKRVHDVSGAGDTVIATMAVALVSGSTLQEAATLANHAAGIVCGEVGIVPIDPEKLLADMSDA